MRLTAFLSPDARVVQGIHENPWGFKETDRTIATGTMHGVKSIE
jgi:hypothetical protein